MGKFINTQRKDTINSLIDGFKDRLKNPYYIHNDKKAKIVDYYSINREKSTLDVGLEIAEAQLGSDSPFKYNLIKDFYLYGGLDQMPIQLENGEFGVSGESMGSTSVILPNTIVPSPGDFFSVQYIDRKCLFEVNSVNVDTLESGANLYEIQYEYSRKDSTLIDNLVVEEYVMIVDNLGTEFRTIINKTNYDFISILDDISVKLKQYYKYLFYTSRVESFILTHKNVNFYDPYVIEFIIRNDILEGDGENYIYLNQQMSLPSTFMIDYDTSIFRSIETKNIKRLSKRIYAYGKYINQPLSLLCINKEEYFSLRHINKNDSYQNSRIQIIDPELIDRIKNNSLYEDINDNDAINAFNKFKGSIKILNDSLSESDSSFKANITITDSGSLNKIKNIIIKYFNNAELTQEDIDSIQHGIDYSKSVDLFYIMPILIYIIEWYVKKDLSNE